MRQEVLRPCVKFLYLAWNSKESTSVWLLRTRIKGIRAAIKEIKIAIDRTELRALIPESFLNYRRVFQ